MRILGIDPALITTGYGLIEARGSDDISLVEAGVIKTDPRDGISRRLADIYENLSGVIDEYSPDVLVLEKIYSHYKHPMTAILMGHARGVVCLLCGLRGVPLVNYPATRIKKSITGNGRARKAQVQKMVKMRLNLGKLPEPVDISDALAMALSYIEIESVFAK